MWQELRLNSSSEIEDALSNYLFELGCVGTRQEGTALVAYFPQEMPTQEIDKAVRTYLTDLCHLGFSLPAGRPVWRQIEARDWNAEWKKHFKPVAISERFMVKPTWEACPADRSEFVIEIDPKQAFGTGTHATTQLILHLLERHDVKDKTVLDVGCGTAILSIAAVHLGAAQVVAFDVDPVAMLPASENVALNGTSAAIQLFAGTCSALSKQRLSFDMVLANLTRNTILENLQQFAELLSDGGKLMLSGLLTKEIETLRESLTSFCFVIEEALSQDEWTALELRKGQK